MLRATNKITALYCRLSVEDTKEKDGKDDLSNSIQHQQIMLMEYACLLYTSWELLFGRKPPR